MRALYWFRHDLRLEDNPGLREAAGANALLMVYCLEAPRPWCNLSGMGDQRRRFLLESLQELDKELVPLGQRLLVLEGNPARLIPELVTSLSINQVFTSLCPGNYERRVIASLEKVLPLQVSGGNSLLDRRQIPGALPAHFTPFKKGVEALDPPSALPGPARLPPPPQGALFNPLPAASCRPHPALPLRGGASEGKRRLRAWFGPQRLLDQYSAKRDCLDGLSGSSTLSPWLANGCLSVRQVAAALVAYERRHGASDSTRWFYAELLWREFFHWRALRDDISLFRLAGSAGKPPLVTFDARNFARWSEGDTNYPLVNACMRQLLATGWVSNRGRQLAASCLVNELGLDWRYGAAFFEKHLLDFDVASNYGNWQYIAGVGADPRGGRHFDLAWQAARHDPQQQFTRKWGGHRPFQPEHVVDAADWPLPPSGPPGDS